MQKKTGIRALSLVLALVMVMGLMPAAKAAPAESETQRFKTIAQSWTNRKSPSTGSPPKPRWNSSWSFTRLLWQIPFPQV